MSWNQGMPLLQTLVSVDGIYPEDFKKFTDDWADNVKKLVPDEVKIQKLENDGNHKCVH